jgi:hypothetical protein
VKIHHLKSKNDPAFGHPPYTLHACILYRYPICMPRHLFAHLPTLGHIMFVQHWYVGKAYTGHSQQRPVTIVDTLTQPNPQPQIDHCYQSHQYLYDSFCDTDSHGSLCYNKQTHQGCELVSLTSGPFIQLQNAVLQHPTLLLWEHKIASPCMTQETDALLGLDIELEYAKVGSTALVC